MSTIRVAACQIDPQIGEVNANLERISTVVTEAAASGAQFIVLPEAAVTGYGFSSLAEALPVARLADSSAEEMLAGLAETHRVSVVCGTLEAQGDEVFNVALVLLPDGRRYRYRKMHLPFLGIDRFATPGPDAPAVIEVDGLRFGVLICYDLRFPEAARICALEGADLIALPTNWPVGVQFHPDLFAPARAAENHCYVLAADRVGTERGTTFMGRSVLFDPDGERLAVASDTNEEIIYGDISPELARSTHVRRRPGEHEWDTIADRRPGLYERLMQPAMDREHPPTTTHIAVESD
ncbi:MAG TPA: carbon-nitrogen hydrolase family protein [Candidatus Limnocylindria bacterium]|jgi:predicted amidohydrolase|nr:carbon-nitrogen hydrolase family protein [Candidatus Limnocylindria bacterium]